MCCRLLMSKSHKLNLARIANRIQQRVELVPGNAKDIPHTLFNQAFRQNLAAGELRQCYLSSVLVRRLKE
jgi:hypothetical protein